MQAIQVFYFNPGKLCLPGHCFVTSVVIFLCLGTYSITGLGPENKFYCYRIQTHSRYVLPTCGDSLEKAHIWMCWSGVKQTLVLKCTFSM